MSISPKGIFASAESFESVYYEDIGINLYKINNVVIKNNKTSSDFIKINDSVYLMPTFIPFGHALIDCYSQYQVIKSKNSNTKILFYDLSELGYSIENNSTKNVIKDLMSICNVESIIDLSNSNLFFKEIILLFDYTDTFLEEFYINVGFINRPHYPPFCKCYRSGSDPCGTNNSWKYNNWSIDYLKNTFGKKENKKENKKFYISRKLVNDKYENILKNNPNDFHAKSRFYQYEEIIENLFKLKGFEIIHPDNMGLFEQIDLFSQASDIAGISGIGLLNMIWADNPTVYEICVNPFYDYHHKEYGLRSGITDYFKIDCRDLNILDTVNKIEKFLV